MCLAHMEFSVHKMTEPQIGGSVIKGKAGNKGDGKVVREGLSEEATLLQIGNCTGMLMRGSCSKATGSKTIS